jgi:OmpR family response regulator RpaB
MSELNRIAKTILIADDEPAVVKILAMRLKTNGYQIIEACNGTETIELTNQKKPDLIILDIKMPDMDGYTVLQNLKASPDTMSIPVVLFTALPPEQTQEKATQLGAEGFVSKSADPDEILAKITETLGQLQTQAAEQR